jgi:hypothetical protein
VPPLEPIPPRDPELVRLYHEALGDAPGTVDDATWSDLEMDEIFRFVDRTRTWIGSQCLYRRLRVLAAVEAELAALTRDGERLRQNPAWSAGARRAMKPLETPDGAFLAPFLLQGLPERLPRPWLFIACALAPLTCLLGALLVPWLAIAGIGFLFVNILINETLGRRLSQFTSPFAQVCRLVAVGKALADLPGGPDLPALERIRACRPTLATVKSRLRTLALDRSQMPELAAVVLGYLNLVFLLDVVAFLRAVPALRAHRTDLVTTLQAVGNLDELLALEALRETSPGSLATPTFTRGRRLAVRGLYHPLLDHPVGNDLTLDERSMLITGSNMAGKTTFLKTLGVNAILARTLHLCMAEEAALPHLSIRSSIRREDRLGSGQSYYLAEVNRLKAFTEDDRPGILLIDEIFRGTNTVERIAASTALLGHLGATHLVLVTTHDLELGPALSGSFDTYHVAEQVTDGVFGFDFKLRKGPVSTRNAIRLLELTGFPPSVTQEARRLAGLPEKGSAQK